MKAVIIGGTGLIGSLLTKMLQDRYDVLAASPKTGVNTITKEGLEEALHQADVVVDVSNSPSFAPDDVMAFFKTSTENLLAAAKKARVRHLIILSVVGTQHLQESGYFRAKKVQEDLVKESDIPFTIVQATQFFEFAGGIVHMSSANGKVILPKAFIRPIAAVEVATFLTEKISGEPTLSTLEIGGPERFEMAEWISQYLKSVSNPVETVSDANARYSGAAINQTTLVPETPVFLGSIHYKDWILLPENKR